MAAAAGVRLDAGVVWKRRVSQDLPGLGYRGVLISPLTARHLDAIRYVRATKSNERRRLMALAFASLPIGSGTKILHFAPAKLLADRLRSSHPEYQTADLKPGRADLTLNIEDIELEANSIDLVLCNHVLDAKAIPELFRILRLAGIVVPIVEGWEATYEDPAEDGQQPLYPGGGRGGHHDLAGKLCCGLRHRHVQVTPLMVCNPSEDTGTSFDPQPGQQIWVKMQVAGAGNPAWGPGDFGLLDLPSGTQSANDIRDAFAQKTFSGCFGSEVDTAPGQKTAISDAINTRLDIYVQSAKSYANDKNAYPAYNVTKGLVWDKGCSKVPSQGTLDTYTGPSETAIRRLPGWFNIPVTTAYMPETARWALGSATGTGIVLCIGPRITRA